MRAVKFLVKLYDMRSEHGTITAFENYANHIYVGTNIGCLLYLQVEGLMEYDLRPTETARGGNTNNMSLPSTSTNTPLSELNDDKLSENGENIESDMAPETIYTSLLAFTHFPESTPAPITQIQHCQSHPLLFVLCNRHLCAFNAFDLTHLFDVPGYIGTFFSYRIGSNRTGGSCEALSAMARTHSPTPPPPDGCLTEETATHVLCAAQHGGRSLFIFEVSLEHGKTSRVWLKQELLLPEPALTLVAEDGVVCVGMRREYSVCSLTNGLFKGLLSLDGASHSPLLALGEGGGVYMRYHHCVFTASMQCALTGNSPDSVPAAAVATAAPPALRGRVYYLRDEVRAMVSQFPFFFVFYTGYCDVFSVFEEEPIESLPLPGGCFAPKPTHGQRVFVAGTQTLWMATLQGVRHQLAAMVDRFKIEEAFELLAAYQRDTHSPQLVLEEELKKKAGIACLQRAHPHMAMRYFGGTINPRELAMHLPECMPLPSLRQQRDLKKPRSSLQCAPLLGKARAEDVGEGFLHPEHIASPLSLPTTVQDRESGSGTNTTINGGGKSSQKMSATSTCEGRRQGSSWNLPVGGLERAWLETYDTFPFVPSDVPALPSHVYSRGSAGCEARRTTKERALHAAEVSGDAKNARGQAVKTSGGVAASSQLLHTITRQVPNMGRVTAKEFVARCWEDFRDAILEYFSLRLAKLWEKAADTADVETSGSDDIDVEKSGEIWQDKLSAAQVMEYVLLVLALRQQDDRGVYRVVSASIGLQVADCYDLLAGLGEYRILSCLLFRRGFVSDALALLRTRVYVSSYFSPSLLSVQSQFLREQSEKHKGNSKQESVDFSVDLLLKYWQQQGYTTVGPLNEFKGNNGEKESNGLDDKERERIMEWMPVLAPVACGVSCLPRRSCTWVLSHLLGITVSPVERRERASNRFSGTARTVPRDSSNTERHKTNANGAAAMLSVDDRDYWARPLAEFYVNGIQEVTKQTSYIRSNGRPREGVHAAFDEADASPEGFPLVGPFELVCHFDANSVVAPNSLSEIFFLVDKLNGPALGELLSTHPEYALCLDEEGCTALHVAFAQGVRRLRGIEVGEGANPLRLPSKAALLERVLAVALRLGGAGCPTAAVNRYGMSCLDIPAAAGAVEVVEIAASALSAVLEVERVFTATRAI